MQQRKNAFSLGLLLFFLNHFFLPLSFLLVLMLYYLCSFLFFSVEKVLSVDENKTRGKLLNWRRMSASYTNGLCLLPLRSFQCYKFYIPPFFHWKRNQLSMPSKKKQQQQKKHTHSHTWSKRALQSYHVNPVFWLTWLDFAWLNYQFSTSTKEETDFITTNKQTEKIDDLFTKQLLFNL